MIVEKKITNSNIFSVEIVEFNENTLNEAIDKFNEYKKRKVIIEGSFEDNIWRLSNENQVMNISFDFNQVLFEKQKKSRLLGSYSDFINCIKCYFIYKFGESILATIAGNISAFKNIFNETEYFSNEKFKVLAMKNIKDDSYASSVKNIIEFLEFWKADIDEKYERLLMNHHKAYIKLTEKDSRQRELGNFESIFKLGDIIHDFVKTCEQSEKEKYFPIILWWEITTILPIRVTEFTLTPYECIKYIDGKYIFSFRRSNLKGSKVKNVTYKIDTDYRIDEITVNKHIKDLIDEYKELVDSYDHIPNFYGDKSDEKEKRRFLFSKRSYYKNLICKESSLQHSLNKEVFRASELRFLLENFYKNIIQNKYNYKIIKKIDDIELHEDEIEFVNLMDTRHYAFINLVLNDVEPMIIKKIGGHKNIQTSMHYYSHVSKFVKCYTYNMAKKIAEKSNSMRGDIAVLTLNDTNRNNSNLLFERIFEINDNSTFRKVKNGICYSKQKQFEDCFDNDNDCDSCIYHQCSNELDKDRIRKRIEKNNKIIEQEIEYIKVLLNKWKKASDLSEQYGQKINKIKALANENSILISKSLKDGGMINE